MKNKLYVKFPDHNTAEISIPSNPIYKYGLDNYIPLENADVIKWPSTYNQMVFDAKWKVADYARQNLPYMNNVFANAIIPNI